jgi:cellulose synthase/poly-beta-1,6-N-acetylglucosamine synthase-like glycosyltransferase
VRTVNWQVVIDVATWFFLVYFIVMGACRLLLNACALLELPRQLEAGLPGLLPRPHERYEPPVSLIMPAFNEEATITAAVLSILHLEYPEFEVIVVNDGSRDGTLEALTREYSLVPFPEAYRRQIESEPVHAIYRSTTHPSLRVIDKANGGKADALNAGMNAARYPLVCVVDADSILERTSLRHVVLPLLTEPHTIASGGCVRIVNGCEVRGGFLEKIGLPRKFLPLAQVVEYLRGFLFGRLGWAPMNAVPIVSGAFGVFRKQAMIDAGGYRSDMMGEDMELILRIHRLNRLAGRPYRIAFLVNPVCWTDGPESPGALRAQRVRWQRGLGESLMHNRGLLFHPRGGAAGWLMYPFMVLFELLGPVVELTGYVFMIAGVAFGFISAAAFWSFMLLAISLGVLLSISALLLEEISCHTYRRPGNLSVLVCMAIAENFGYRQLVLVWRLEGLYRWATAAPAKWGVMKRSASLQGPRR